MSGFNKIIQALNIKIQNLSENGDNQNGQIDTTNEKNELAKLLAGANQEIGDLFNSKKAALEKQSAKITKKNYDEQYKNLKNNKNSAISEIEKLVYSLVNSLNGYEQAFKKAEEYDQVVKVVDGEKYSNYEREWQIQAPDLIAQKDNIYKINPDNSYEEILEESQDNFTVIIRDAEGKEIGRKAYTGDKTGVHTDKDDVAARCGLNVKNDIEHIKTGPIKRLVSRILLFPFAGRLYEGEDSRIDVLNRLNDDEAVNMQNDLLYKWNPKTNEYEKVGKVESGESMHTFGVKLWGEKLYD